LSFHYLCTDPPLDPDHLPEGDWHCVRCIAQRSKPANLSQGRGRGEVGTILRLYDSATTVNPTAFTLPESVVDYFEGGVFF